MESQVKVKCILAAHDYSFHILRVNDTCLLWWIARITVTSNYNTIVIHNTYSFSRERKRERKRRGKKEKRREGKKERGRERKRERWHYNASRHFCTLSEPHSCRRIYSSALLRFLSSSFSLSLSLLSLARRCGPREQRYDMQKYVIRVARVQRMWACAHTRIWKSQWQPYQNAKAPRGRRVGRDGGKRGGKAPQHERRTTDRPRPEYRMSGIFISRCRSWKVASFF